MAALHDRLRRMFEKAEAKYKQERVEERMETLAKLYDSEQQMVSTGSIIHVNKVYPRVRTAMSSMFGKRPEIVARGRRAQDAEAARHGEFLLNYLTRALKLSREIREWLFWARLTPYGVLKLGMRRWRGFELPTFITHDPRSVRVDPTTARFRPEEGSWQAFRYRQSVASLRGSRMYDDRALDGLMDALAGRDPDATEDVVEVEIWEHYAWEQVEGKRKLMLAVSAHRIADQALAPDDWRWIREEPFTDVVDLPGRFLYFIPSPRRFFPVSPIELWMDQQREINAFRSQKLLHAERSNRKRIYDVSSFSEEERAKFEDPNPDLYIAALPTRNQTIRDAIIEEPLTTVSPDVYTGEIEADNTITEIDGVGSAQLSSEMPKRGSTSATRDAIMEHALKLRGGDNQEIFDEALEDAYQGLLNLAQVHFKGALSFRLFGNMEMTITPDAIKGDVDVILSFGSTTPRDVERDWDEAVELYGLFKGDPHIDQVRLKRYVLQKRRDVKDAEHWIIPTPMPMLGLGGVPGSLPGMPPGGPPPRNGGGLPVVGNPQAAEQLLAREQREAGASPLSIAAGIRNLI